MIERLKKEGLLDGDGGLTQTGHQYVEDLKNKLVREQARAMAEIAAAADGYDLGERDEIWDRAEAA